MVLQQSRSTSRVRIEAIDPSGVASLLTRFETELHSHGSVSPVVAYARTLRALRKDVQAVQTQRQEIEFGRTFQQTLSALARELQLDDDHFSIDVSGEPLLVREERGEHLISPTHFENGAYFSHPHADHQLDWSADELPRIKIGRYVRFGRGASVNAGGDLTIGDAAWLSPGSQLLRQDHDPYGRPSVGSRTVAMTRLPAVTLEAYAWIGREAIVGWGADYVGKASICATRSFVNSWIGDYSITGDRGRIIQYLPFKAYALEHGGLSLRDVLAIADWSAINEAWIAHYRATSQSQESEASSGFASDLLRKGQSVLVVAPRDLAVLAGLKGQRTDVIDVDRWFAAYVLQWAQDNGKHDVRFRGDLRPDRLPFATAGEQHYRRVIGYDAVVCCRNQEGMSPELLREAARVLRSSGLLIAPRGWLDDVAAVDVAADAGLRPRTDITIGSEAYTVFAKLEH